MCLTKVTANSWDAYVHMPHFSHTVTYLVWDLCVGCLCCEGTWDRIWSVWGNIALLAQWACVSPSKCVPGTAETKQWLNCQPRISQWNCTKLLYTHHTCRHSNTEIRWCHKLLQSVLFLLHHNCCTATLGKLRMCTRRMSRAMPHLPTAQLEEYVDVFVVFKMMWEFHHMLVGQGFVQLNLIRDLSKIRTLINLWPYFNGSTIQIPKWGLRKRILY